MPRGVFQRRLYQTHNSKFQLNKVKTKTVHCSVDHIGYQTSVGPFSSVESESADLSIVVNSKSPCFIARTSKSTATAANGFTVKCCF